MLIRRIFYPVSTLGPNKRLGIWTMGCIHGCLGCIAKDTWDFDLKRSVSVSDILDLAYDYYSKNHCKSVTISGGDPFFQADLTELLIGLKKMGYEDILVYTGFTLETIQANPLYQTSLDYIDVLIDGLYVDSLNDNLPLRGSSNQRIIFLNQTLMSIYEPMIKGVRTIDYITHGDYIDIYGIVPKGYQSKIEALKKK